MGYVILDLEFNNLSDITKYYSDFYSTYPQFKEMDCPNEIIEIGAVRVDKYLQEIDSLKIYVKPYIFPMLNPKIKEITGIEDKDVNNGIPFEEAIKILENFTKEDDIICSWAKDDVAEIIRNASYHGINHIDWINKYIDIQEYCTKVMGEKKSLSLKRAIEKLSIRKDEGRLHDALNDSLYTLEVFKRVYNFRVVKNYIIEDILNMPAIMVKSLEDKDFEEDKVEFICPKCKEILHMESPVKVFKWRFLTLSHCDRCNANILNEVMVKKTLKGNKVYKNNKSIISEAEYLDYSYKLGEIS
ncbi:3'-5' exonuclease [Clostridium hydrogeniformans]|uniref:3'-5' exonuclease n=1 Tax=Clostridium hydrogeniformans TaxID=349933 RepID=UPI000485CA63|nr:3'-5' exonuclease [Clostridium hydrogeniformans]